MSGGLSSSGKVDSLSSRDWGVVFAPSSIRVKMPGNPGTLGLGAVTTTSSMVLQVRCTGARVGVGCKFGLLRACVWAVGKSGDGAGGNVFYPCCLVPAVPAWRACINARMSGPQALYSIGASLALCSLGIARERQRTLER